MKEVKVPTPRTGRPNGSSTGNHDESSAGLPDGMPASSKCAAGAVVHWTPAPLRHYKRMRAAAAAAVH
jgi:hypothetical protein